MNVPLCLWLASRQRDRLGVMFHEVAFPMSRDQPMRHNFLGLVTRAMAAILARSARRIFVTTSAWEPLLRSISHTQQPIQCVPTFSNIPVVEDEAGANAIRDRLSQRLQAHVRDSLAHLDVAQVGHGGADLLE